MTVESMTLEDARDNPSGTFCTRELLRRRSSIGTDIDDACSRLAGVVLTLRAIKELEGVGEILDPTFAQIADVRDLLVRAKAAIS